MPLHAYMARMSQPLSRPNAIANWLYAVASLVFLMVVVGGITRLTESGLSITEWKPVTGALPPLTDQDWQEAFDKYRQIPEYQLHIWGCSLFVQVNFQLLSHFAVPDYRKGVRLLLVRINTFVSCLFLFVKI